MFDTCEVDEHFGQHLPTGFACPAGDGGGESGDVMVALFGGQSKGPEEVGVVDVGVVEKRFKGQAPAVGGCNQQHVSVVQVLLPGTSSRVGPWVGLGVEWPRAGRLEIKGASQEELEDVDVGWMAIGVHLEGKLVVPGRPVHLPGSGHHPVQHGSRTHGNVLERGGRRCLVEEEVEALERARGCGAGEEALGGLVVKGDSDGAIELWRHVCALQQVGQDEMVPADDGDPTAVVDNAVDGERRLGRDGEEGGDERGLVELDGTGELKGEALRRPGDRRVCLEGVEGVEVWNRDLSGDALEGGGEKGGCTRGYREEEIVAGVGDEAAKEDGVAAPQGDDV